MLLGGKMEYKEEEKGSILILRIEGRLDAITSPVLDEKITSLIDSGKHLLMLDLEKVDYLSSAGLRLLLSALKKLEGIKGKMAVTSVQDDVMELIKMAGFDQVLKLFATEAEAEKYLS